ncbi:MAG: metallophosphoesterase [Anaerolineales bacterium]
MTTVDRPIPLLRPRPHRTTDLWQGLAFNRLTTVFERATEVPFDDASRIVFFSDSHRGDGSRVDAFTPNEPLFLHALHRYFREGFTYIEVGDGDELWQNGSFSAIRRAHREVFDLLHQFETQGRLHLILGNHDLHSGRSRRVEKDGLVAIEGLILRHVNTAQRIFVTHGHQADAKSDYFHWISRWAVHHVWRRVQWLGLFRNPRIGRGKSKESIEQRIIAWVQDQRQAIICGHTHRPIAAPFDSTPYFNTGCCIVPHLLTGLEIQNGEITLVKWRMAPDGSPQSARRTLLTQPQPLRRFRF